MSDSRKPKPEKREPVASQPASEAPPVTTPIEDSSTHALSESLKSSFRIIRLLMFGLVILFVASGVYNVEPNQVVVLLRFGKPVGTGDEMLKGPGLHWAFPYPIDEKVRINVRESRSVTSTAGWHATTAAMESEGLEPNPKGYLGAEADGYVLTADGNIIHARATVKYRISDPLQFQFGFADVETILTNVVNNALFYAASRMTAENALYKDKSGFRDLVLGRVNRRAEALQLGIELDPSDVVTKPPVDVKEAFDRVIAAEQERSTKIREARGYFDQTVSRARGEADRIVNSGQVSANRLLREVVSDAQAFEAQLPEYEKNPWLFRNRLLASRMKRILTNVQEKIFLPELPEGRSRELRLLLSREPQGRESVSQR